MPARAAITIAMLVCASGCKGPPARLLAGTTDTVVVNNVRPVQLPIRVLDSRGRELKEMTSLRYQQVVGVSASISATGAVTCRQPGDANVHVSLGALATDVVVRCRPVRELHVQPFMTFVVGEPARELPFEAIGVDGQPVTLLTGQITVRDSTIATVEGTSVYARRPGHTQLVIRVGDKVLTSGVSVYQRGSTPEGLRPGQNVAVPVQLAAGEIRRWRLAAAPEPYYIAMLPDRDAEWPRPGLAVAGARCWRMADTHSFSCYARQDAWLYVYYPQHLSDSARALSGMLAVWRSERP